MFSRINSRKKGLIRIPRGVGGCYTNLRYIMDILWNYTMTKHNGPSRSLGFTVIHISIIKLRIKVVKEHSFNLR